MQRRLQEHVLKIIGQRRIRIGAGGKAFPSWMTPENCPIRISGYVGDQGQIALFPDRLNPIKNSLVESIEREVPSDEDFEAVADFARVVAGTYALTISYEENANRFAISLPSELEDVGLTPKIGEHVVLLVLWERVELWNPPIWNQYRKALATRLSTLAEEASSIFGGSGE